MPRYSLTPIRAGTDAAFWVGRPGQNTSIPPGGIGDFTSRNALLSQRREIL
jgi:hypothetical protein